MRTFSLKAGEMQRKWWLVDAADLVLGRLASQVALRLRGKHKPTFTPHMDCGDGVIVINADKVCLSGKKLTDKHFYWHTGYPGGIKSRAMQTILGGQHGERLVQKAVERMISRNPLGRQQMRHLKVYKGAEHPHTGQNPEVWDLKAANTKNVLRRGA